MSGPKRVAHALDRFTYDFELANDAVLDQFIVQEVIPREAVDV